MRLADQGARQRRPLARLVGEVTEVPRRFLGRGPPYWKSRVLRSHVLDDDEGGRARQLPLFHLHSAPMRFVDMLCRLAPLSRPLIRRGAVVLALCAVGVPARGMAAPDGDATAVVTSPASTATPLLWAYRLTVESVYINSISVSGDGERILAGTFYHDYSRPHEPDYVPPLGRYGTFLLDRRGKLLWKDEFSGHQGVYHTALSHSGRWAASSGWYSNAPDTGFVSIYAADSGRKIVDFRGAGARVSSVAFSRDERVVAAGADVLYVFRRTGRGFALQPSVVALPPAATSETRRDKVTSIAVSADGRYVVAGTIQGQIVVVRVRRDSAAVVGRFRAEGPVRTVAMAARRDFVVAGAGAGLVYGFELDDLIAGRAPAWLQRFDGAGAIFGVAITDDGRRAAAVSNVGTGGQLGLIDNARQPGAWLWRAALPRNPNAVSIGPQARYVAVADGYPNGKPAAFALFDGRDGAALWSHPTGDMSWPIEISTNGAICIAGSDDGQVYAFRLPDPAVPAEKPGVAPTR